MSAVENPPAFPRTGEGFGSPKYDTPGMILRDWFAGQAIMGLEARGVLYHPNMVARDAYALADAMLIERARAASDAHS